MDNVVGVKKTYLKQLEGLKGESFDKDLIASELVIETLCDITEKIGREIAVYIDRKGEVLDVSIGDENTVTLKSFDKRRSEESLSGVRCIHTHPNGEGMLSDVDVSALRKMKFDLMAAVGVRDGRPTNAYIGFLGVDETKQMQPVAVGPYTMERLLKVNIRSLIDDVENNLRDIKRVSREVNDETERAVLVGIESEEDLEELRELLKTAGGVEVSRMVQSREKRDTATFIGKGKLKELTLLVQALDANLVVFDEELSGAQIRNLEEAVGVKVIDRTQLILDIFAQRAKSREGKLQVELAQLKYAMPRLVGLGSQMSRTGGGIGTRGPGEKKLEIDRRRIRERIYDLENELKEIKKQRELHRSRREGNNVFQVCLVGYTNAGKSTLLNSLADADIYAKDQLFATLDPTTRKVTVQSGKEVLVTDTVGFIRKLPHDLIDAFKSTLEEVLYADLLIHVVDGSNPEYETHMQVVLEVLDELGAGGKPIVTAINKADKIIDREAVADASGDGDAPLFLSALQKTGLNTLLERIEFHASQQFKIIDIVIPYTEGNMLSMVHKNANVLSEEYGEEGIRIRAEVDPVTGGRLASYIRE